MSNALLGFFLSSKFNVITKDLKKLGYDTSPRNELPFGGTGASTIATGFDAGQQSGQLLPEQESEIGQQSGVQVIWKSFGQKSLFLS